MVLGLFKKASAGKGRIGLAFGANQIAVAVMRRDGAGPVLERCELLPFDPAVGCRCRSPRSPRRRGSPACRSAPCLRPTSISSRWSRPPRCRRPNCVLRCGGASRTRIDFRVEEAVIDVFDVPDQNRGGHGRMMYAVAARRSAVDRHASALAGTSSFRCDRRPRALSAQSGGLLPAAAAGVALLHLGETTASIVLVRGNTFYLARQMDLAQGSRSPQRAAAGRGRARRGRASRRRRRRARAAALLGLLRAPFRPAADHPHRGFARRPPGQRSSPGIWGGRPVSRS